MRKNLPIELPGNVLFIAAMSCSNFVFSAATRAASRDLMASLECEFWTTLQMIVLSSSLAGIVFDTDEAFPLSTATLTISIKTVSRRREIIAERIVSSDLATSKPSVRLPISLVFRSVVKTSAPCVCLCLQMSEIN